MVRLGVLIPFIPSRSTCDQETDKIGIDMTWGIFHEKELLRREPRVRDALDWVNEFKGVPVHKEKIDRPGVYDLIAQHGFGYVHVGTLRRVDPKGVIAEYPVASLPKYHLSQWQIDMADVIRHDGSLDLEYGNKVPIILALASVGWTERSIAAALLTSRTYVMRVLGNPAGFLGEN